jgi:hypothetical protein
MQREKRDLTYSARMDRESIDAIAVCLDDVVHKAIFDSENDGQFGPPVELEIS